MPCETEQTAKDQAALDRQIQQGVVDALGAMLDEANIELQDAMLAEQTAEQNLADCLAE